MGKSRLMCVLLGSLAWGQAAPSAPPTPQPQPAPNQAPADTSASVPAEAAVLTINGVCPPQPKAAATAAKSAAGAKPARNRPTNLRNLIGTPTGIRVFPA